MSFIDPAIEQMCQRLRTKKMSTDQIIVAATQLLACKRSEVAKHLFHILKDAPPSEVIGNVFGLFDELSIRDADWSDILQKSIAKKGRCPRSLRSDLIRRIRQRSQRIAGSASSVADLAESEVFANLATVMSEERSVSYLDGAKIEYRTTSFFSGKRRATLPLSTDLTDIRRMEALAVVLGRLELPIDEFVVDLSGVEHVYVVGMAALAAWCQSKSIVPVIQNASQVTQRYLDVVGFGGSAVPAATRPQGTLPSFYTMAIEPLAGCTKPDTVATALVEIIIHHMPAAQQSRSGLLVTFAELIENVSRHAGPSVEGFACAQVYPKQNKLCISIVDTGIGIRDSIMSGTNYKLIARLESGESAVRLAIAPLITSKPDRHSGYGLYVASELAVRNGGTFRIFSGNEVLTVYRRRWQRMQLLNKVKVPWRGTWIAMLIDLNSVLPIGDVYSTLPPSDGAELDDFFAG